MAQSARILLVLSRHAGLGGCGARPEACIEPLNEHRRDCRRPRPLESLPRLALFRAAGRQPGKPRRWVHCFFDDHRSLAPSYVSARVAAGCIFYAGPQ